MLFSLAHDQPHHEAHADRAGQHRQERQYILHVSHSSKTLFDFDPTLDYSIGDNDTIVKGTIVNSIRAADVPFAIEAPSGRSFTLGNFLDIWRKRFAQLGYPSELDQSDGWQAYVNGKPFAGDFHTIPLQAHTLITLAYHSPGVKPDTTYNWNGL